MGGRPRRHLVVLEATWRPPTLGVRTDAVIAGVPLPPGALHAWYIAAEAVKAVALPGAGIGAMHGAWRP